MTKFFTDASPFFVYDRKKFHGLVYSPSDKLYHYCDRYSVNKITKNILPLEIDIRPFVDLINDKIPVGDKVLVLSSNEFRDRNSSDFYTYSLEYPVFNKKLNDFFEQLTPKHKILQDYIFNSLISYTPNQYIIIKGNESSVTILFKILSLLNPIIKVGSEKLYSESVVKNKIVTEVYQSRIVLCSVKNKLIRVAKIQNKQYKYPIQYHGIIYYQNMLFPNKYDQLNEVIELNNTNKDINPTTAEVFGWILNGKCTKVV